MAGSPALLLLLSLGLCCTRAQGQRDAEVVWFVPRNMKNPQEGQRLEMECSPNNVDNGASWIRQDKDGKLHFIVYISVLSRTTYSGNENTSSEFEGSGQGRFYRLVVKNFRAQDQGTYFCVNYINQVLHFSSGQRAFFPVTTEAPTTPAATTQSRHVSKNDTSHQSLHPGTSSKNTLTICCDIVIWINLAGACLLLLTAITITIMHCQRPSSP
ncbi:T-cell surface glycoprotein CD8 alpha chain-like isoform X4 [Gallus gallus]|uniref:T-cell surface glycoprotein CD8 alpha chain-like isoform X4 n=1 Tax=Gallus gallus TaxID=9031 RepID=UPI001F01D5B4|nr:T-cell surface glycoprotein CD8 alpha chain-like isoform X4 [Gallus gallus]